MFSKVRILTVPCVVECNITIFQDNFTDTGSSQGVLSQVPSALSRWTEEARVLDSESLHDAITGC